MTNPFKSINKDDGLDKINFSYFLDEENSKLEINQDESSKPKRKKQRKKKVNIITEGAEDKNLKMHETNKPYDETYDETTNMLKGSICEIDLMNSELKGDIDKIRSSKTLKNKYNYISEMSSTRGTLIGTKITAIREINNSITNAHNLELKRIKELKLNEKEQDDDKYIMDMYNAFISTPVGTRQNDMVSPSMIDMTQGTNIISTNLQDNNYNSYISSPSNSIQNSMRLETNPNIKTVVMYDQSTGNRWFDVIDTITGNSISNVEKPDPMFLEDTKIDLNNGIARNTNLDITYPLIIINNNINKY